MNISYGVPQGSILGPLLFSLYINDLPDAVTKCKVILYADDTALIYSNKNKTIIEKTLNQDMANVKLWLDSNKLTLNVKKTKCMLIGNSQMLARTDSLDLKVDGDKIEQVKEFKYLGVWIDQTMKFSTHINKIASKISSAIGIISKISHYLTEKHRKTLYNAMILPHFNYCSISWSTTDNKYLDILEKLQKRAGRMILMVPKLTRTKEVYSTLKWTDLKTKWKINRCIMVHKCLNNNIPDYLHGHFQITNHGYSTRAAKTNKLVNPLFRTVQGQRTFKFTGSRDFNSLPHIISSIIDHKSFKRDTKHHFLTNYQSTLQ